MARKRAVVLGGGIIGLTTAIIAQRRGFDVVIYTARDTMRTTSAKAAAVFKPHVVDNSYEFQQILLDTWSEYERIVVQAGVRTGVRRQVHWDASSQEREPPEYLTVMRDVQSLARPHVPGGLAFGWRYETYFIDTPIFLPWLVGVFHQLGGRIMVLPEPFGSLRDALGLPGDVLFNCTGLGARELCEDSAVIPVKGQIAVVPRVPEMQWSISADGFYVFPREGETVVGGTAEWGVDDEGVDLSTIDVILRGNKRILPELEPSSVLRTYAGLRPYRDGGVRIQAEILDGRQVVHNYGHGGSGFTLCWGSAVLAVDLA